MRGTVRLALVLGILHAFASVADAAAPVYQGIITSPTLCSPRGIALAPGGGLFVGSDCSALSHMEEFDAAGNLVASWPYPARYQGPPNGIAIDASNHLYVLDPGGLKIVKCTTSGALITSWPSVVQQPVDIAVDASGNVYVAELDGRRVRKTTSTGTFLGVFGSSGSGPGQFQGPSGVAVDASGRVYATDPGRGRVLRFLANGTFDMEFATPSAPVDVAVGPDGNIYVISFSGSLGYQYSPSGVYLGSFGSPLVLEQSYRIIIDSGGMMYVCEQYGNRVTKFQIDMTTPATPVTFGRLKATYR